MILKVTFVIWLWFIRWSHCWYRQFYFSHCHLQNFIYTRAVSYREISFLDDPYFLLISKVITAELYAPAFILFAEKINQSQ